MTSSRLSRNRSRFIRSRQGNRPVLMTMGRKASPSRRRSPDADRLLVETPVFDLVPHPLPGFLSRRKQARKLLGFGA
jgi:hypothetical protein